MDLTAVPWSNLLVAFIAFLVTALVAVRGKGIRQVIPFLIGIVAGYVAAALLGMVDFAPVWSAHLIEMPHFYMPFVHYNLNFAAVLTIVPIALVTMVEHVGDHKVLSEIIGRDLIEDPGLQRTLLGDGVGSMAGAFFGCCPNTTYGESVGCVALTKNASVVTIRTAALLSICLAFFSPFVAFVNTIPSCVLGGICTALYGFIAVSGLKMIQTVDLNKERNLFVVSSILVLGIGGFMLDFGALQITSIAASLIVGILVNQFLKEKEA